MDKVIIVNAGEYGELSAEKGSYDHLIDSLKDVIEEPLPDKKEKPTEVEVVDSVEKALEIIQRMGLNISVTLIFVTRGLLGKAEQIQKEYPGLKVIVYTGAVPKGRVIVLGKRWKLDGEALQSIVLS